MKKNKSKWKILVLVMGIFLSGCSGGEKNNIQEKKIIDLRKLKEQFIKANRHNLQKEKDIIEQYIRNHNQPYRFTPQGIYFYLISSSASADSIRAGQSVRVFYKIFLLDGTLCYEVPQQNPVTIVVEKDYTESGVHRGLQMMKRGERARMIIPSYLAHGLLGDMNKIPPQSPVLVDISVLP